MKLINADKVIKTLRERKKLFCRNQIEFRMLPPDQKARVDEIDTCIAELVNAEEVPTTEADTDTISRQAAIETVMECYDNDELFEVYEDKLRELPPAQPAQPERIKGHWVDAVIPNDSGSLPVIVCDQCNTFFPLQFGDGHNFCPNCGADMREVTDGNHN